MKSTPPAAPPSVRLAEFLKSQVTPPAPPAARETGTPDVSVSETERLSRRLAELEQQLEQFSAQSALRSPQTRDPADLPIVRRLRELEVDDETGRLLLDELRPLLTPDDLSDPIRLNHQLTRAIERRISCGSVILPQENRPRVVALVGPTGVGKTTTIAKLAANFRIHDGIRMGLVTVDTYRIAAVEQLRTYAEIIDLPMRVATNPLEMEQAIQELQHLDLILVDTAGRSPRDDLQVGELKNLLAAGQVDDVHLVLSLTASLSHLVASAAKFAAVQPKAIILTKLDEVSPRGHLLGLTRSVSLPVSYVTTGQNVPRDIEPAHPRRIARLITGIEHLNRPPRDN